MKSLIKNPLTIWLMAYIKSKVLEKIHKKNSLKIGYMANISNCEFGQYNTIYDNVDLTNVKLGDFTYISSNTQITNARIGKFCSIGPNCKIGLGKHPSKYFVSTHPIFYSNLNQSQITFADDCYYDEFGCINIGNDVWLGANVIILDGVTISDGCIVGAGAVVTKNMPPYSVVGGIPAKLIKYRFEEKDIQKLINLKWWDLDIVYLKNNYKKFHNIKDFLQETDETNRNKVKQ